MTLTRRIAILGAGAVGCYYGGMLARAGHRVTLIGRPGHVLAMKQSGLLLEKADFFGPIAVEASTSAAAIEGAEWVLCCVKSSDTEAAARAMAPHLSGHTLVFSLQNGVDNAQRLQMQLHQRVIPMGVYVATEMAGPGHVKHHGRGELIMGTVPGSSDIQSTFESAGIPVQLSDNVTGILWNKLIINCAYNALSALTRIPYGTLVQGVGIPEVMRDVVQECLAVAQADGVTLASDPWPAVEMIARTMPHQLSSTAQDLAQGKPTEIDHLNGYVVQRGAERGIPTPVNRTLHSLVKLLETTQSNAYSTKSA